MILDLPSYEDPFYTFSIPLEGINYVFQFRYNQREDRWYFNIALPDGTELANGIKVTCGRNLLDGKASVLLPPGQLVAIASGTDDSSPGLTELGEGKRVSLVYVTSDEVA